MSLRIIEISAPDESSDKIKDLAEEYAAIDSWRSTRKSWLSKNKDADQRTVTRILIDVQNQQNLIDALTRAVNDNEGWRILLLPVEANLPKRDTEEKEQESESQKSLRSKKRTWLNIKDLLKGSVTREELLEDVERGGRLSFDFALLAFLSTIVAGIGLVQSDVAIIIGAMVIAPLLGPNLALAFGAALGDKPLILNAIKTNIVGLGLTLFIAFIAGYFIQDATVTNSTELMNRTNVNYANIILALAAGGAAVLSLTTGVSSGLVGVMVAVALMPPAVALGLTLGNGQFAMAYGAAVLLATNVVCINLAALAVFRLKGIKPRTWYEEKQARKASQTNAIIWITMLVILAGLIWLKQSYTQ